MILDPLGGGLQHPPLPICLSNSSTLYFSPAFMVQPFPPFPLPESSSDSSSELSPGRLPLSSSILSPELGPPKLRPLPPPPLLPPLGFLPPFGSSLFGGSLTVASFLTSRRRYSSSIRCSSSSRFHLPWSSGLIPRGTLVIGSQGFTNPGIPALSLSLAYGKPLPKSIAEDVWSPKSPAKPELTPPDLPTFLGVLDLILSFTISNDYMRPINNLEILYNITR
ncbi:hypothetical protein SPLC1_S103370 [Arthrospira platensis C1]|nr:hypothetical protein SPLC1_S532720 [Arthrospira platensis C1]EKD10307.1 hypothetical protein SPLC1_S103370 [Arthrospira platensis C1]